MLLDMGDEGIKSDKQWLLKQVLEKRNIKQHTATDHKDTAPPEAGNGNHAAY